MTFKPGKVGGGVEHCKRFRAVNKDELGEGYSCRERGGGVQVPACGKGHAMSAGGAVLHLSPVECHADDR